MGTATFGFSPELESLIKQGVAIALDKLSAMLARLDEPDQATLALINKYVIPANPFRRPLKQRLLGVAPSIRRDLRQAVAVLNRPFDELFVSSNDLHISRELRAKIIKSIALELDGHIFIHDRLVAPLTPLQAARVVLHEVMHVVLTGDDENFAFLERGVEKLAEVKALNNADSFVGLVLDDVLEQAKVFSFRPERP